MTGFHAWTSAAFIALCLAASTTIIAQDYPTKPIRWIVPFAPGGGNDIVARMVAQKLGERWSQQVVIDNRAGAGGNIAAEIAAHAAPDGYTLFLLNSANLIAPSLYRHIAYDPVRDFSPITLMAVSPFLVVVQSESAMRTLGDLIAQARARPGTVSYASGGNGSSTHLTAELLAQHAGIKLVHIPYKGAGPALIDLLGGQVAFYMSSVLPAVPYLNAGRIRALAVTGTHRLKVLPEVPTANEAGMSNFESTVTYGVVGPNALPADIKRKLHTEIERVLKLPELRGRLESQGMEIVASAPSAYASAILTEVAKWKQVVKVSGARVD